MDDEWRQGIKREFRYALPGLAASAPDQIRVLSPGCIACELLDDYNLELRQYREVFRDSFTRRRVAAIARLDRAIDVIPESDHECFNNDILTHPAWDGVRATTTETPAAFGWPEGPPPDYTETAPGILAAAAVMAVMTAYLRSS